MNTTTSLLARMRPRPITGCAVLAAMAALLPATASAAVIIHDDFTTVTSSGKPAAAAATTDNTGLTGNHWFFRDYAYYDAGSDRIISSNTGGKAGGAISTGTTLSALTAGIIEVSGKYVINNEALHSGDIGNGVVPVDWVAVGFLAGTISDSSDINATNSGLLWAIVRPDGRWTLFTNGTTTTLADSTSSTQLPAFPASTTSSVTYTDITVKYDLDTKAAALFVNGANVSGWISYDLNLATTSITGAGFKIWAASGSQPRTATLNEFTVSASSFAIPEPATTALLAGGIVLALLAAKNHRHTIR
ncbi:MAG: hypothetical protein LBK99_08025 [Opitutaceae bacterium]|nr:hypothetical protein [Opitutaceae bacterium]